MSVVNALRCIHRSSNNLSLPIPVWQQPPMQISVESIFMCSFLRRNFKVFLLGVPRLCGVSRVEDAHHIYRRGRARTDVKT